MKNRINIFLALAVIIFITLGCNLTSSVQKTVSGDNNSPSASSDDNRTIAEKTIDDTLDESTGVPECDAAFKTINDEITRETAKNDDSWIVRGTRKFMFSQMKKALKSSIDEHEKDANSNVNKQQLAEACSDFQKKIDVEIKKDIANGK